MFIFPSQLLQIKFFQKKSDRKQKNCSLYYDCCKFKKQLYSLINIKYAKSKKRHTFLPCHPVPKLV